MQLNTLNINNKQDFSPYIQWTKQEFIKNFCIMKLRKGTQKDVTNPPQWDGFLYVLGASNSRSLSLDGAANPDKNGTQRELTSKKQKKI